jgi:hypothetical protein
METFMFLTHRCLPARAILAVAFALGLSYTALAQNAAPPAAAATFDVCADETTGRWRYSGVVTVPGLEGAQVGVVSRIQNQTSREGYVDAATASAGLPQARAGSTLVVPYSVEAPPLSLGVLRSAATVQLSTLTDPTLRTLFVESGMVTADAVCGCAPKGCVRTQGYWGNKPSVVWPAPYSRQALFFSSGLSWQQILDTPPRGSGYLILAHQYIAAVLNRAAGASAPSGVQSVINAAGTWFSSGTVPSTCGPGDCATQKTWAGILDTYNNGQYPGAPKHCD